MATIVVSLPDRLKDWVEEQVRTDQYDDAGDYVRDLIEKDEERRSKIAEMQKLIDEGFDSGLSSRSRAEILADARSLAGVGSGDL